jgi:hypothetical protein
MISPNLHAIWVFFLLNLSQELKSVLLLYFGTLGDGYSLKGSKKKPSRHNPDNETCPLEKRYQCDKFEKRRFGIGTTVGFTTNKGSQPHSQDIKAWIQIMD